ncbi:MAG: stage VI sporulation protein F [Bacilli bacterium]|jgi:hypothetical protein|nr:stage VI sporulation protein F [Bacilli bacterium]
MEINDNVFNKIEKKTNVSKENIINIASKLNEGNMKDPNTLSDIIHELANLTGKNVSKEKEDKIIELIVNDKVPKNIDNMI